MISSIIKNHFLFTDDIIHDSTFLSLNACGKENNEPNVNITVEILSITDQQFQSIGTSGIEKPSKDDFKNFKFSLDVQNSNNVKKRKIFVPNFSKSLIIIEITYIGFGNLQFRTTRVKTLLNIRMILHFIQEGWMKTL